MTLTIVPKVFLHASKLLIPPYLVPYRIASLSFLMNSDYLTIRKDLNVWII